MRHANGILRQAPGNRCRDLPFPAPVHPAPDPDGNAGDKQVAVDTSTIVTVGQVKVALLPLAGFPMSYAVGELDLAEGQSRFDSPGLVWDPVESRPLHVPCLKSTVWSNRRV